MEREFTRAIYWKIFYSAVSIGWAAFTLILYLSDHSKVGPWYLLIPFVSFIFATIVVIKQVRSKFIISADYIKVFSTFRTKELLTANVKGFRIESRYIVIEPISLSYSKLVLNNYDDYDDIEDLTAWLKENFTNLDATDLKEQEHKVLSNPALGTTEIERKKKLTAAKIIAVVYSGLGVVLTFASITSSSRFVIYLLLGYPLLGIFIMGLNPLIKFVSDSKRSVYPFIMLGILPPVFISFINALGEYDVYQSSNTWLPFFGIALLLIFLIYKTGINNALPLKSQIIIILIAGLLYGYGSTIHINCDFDESRPKLIQTSIYNKWIEHSKGTHYHLKLVAWDGNQKPKDIEVSQITYDKYINGAPIDVYVKKGLLNIPWYSLYK